MYSNCEYIVSLVYARINATLSKLRHSFYLMNAHENFFIGEIHYF